LLLIYIQWLGQAYLLDSAEEKNKSY
jgi:hypothetical protein